MESLRDAMHGIPSSAKTRGKQTVATKSDKADANSTQAAKLPPVSGPSPDPGSGNNNGSGVDLTMHSHFYQVEFLNSSDQVEIKGDKSLDSYNNYFIGNDPAKWKSNCKIYQAVIYKNIYPNIDLRYYTEKDQLKYDLVVHPGGNPDNIVLKYKGVDNLIIKKGIITVQTSVGDIKEMIPRTYQFSKEGNKDLECVYMAGPDHTIRFHVSNYSPSATLIIDPTLVFSVLRFPF
jgi:hypothetical protein